MSNPSNGLTLVNRALELVPESKNAVKAVEGFDVVDTTRVMRDINPVPARAAFAQKFNASVGEEVLEVAQSNGKWRDSMLRYSRNPKVLAAAVAAGLFAVGGAAYINVIADAIEANGGKEYADAMRTVAAMVRRNVAEETGDRSAETVIGESKIAANQRAGIEDAQFILIDGIFDAGLDLEQFAKLRDAIFGVESHYIDRYSSHWRGRRRS